MSRSRISEIKHAQKESNLFHKIAQFFLQIKQDEPKLEGLSISRVALSPDKGTCTVFFFCSGGLKEYEAIRPTLVLYKHSIRKALAASIPGRYTPNIKFSYDPHREKQRRVDELLDSLKEEGTE
jgi:ribosome-binding factor A